MLAINKKAINNVAAGPSFQKLRRINALPLLKEAVGFECATRLCANCEKMIRLIQSL
jgi:hypothetical protein